MDGRLNEDLQSQDVLMCEHQHMNYLLLYSVMPDSFISLSLSWSLLLHRPTQSSAGDMLMHCVSPAVYHCTNVAVV